MPILKCKMCGGDMEMSQDRTFATCEYCGSTVTMPKTDDEQRINHFNRGNHLRRNAEFDKAAAVFERIIAQDDSDAEAHWCLVLCRYGIEYVEDPTTHERVPTCHRASFDSILNDVDYQAALKYSDGVTRSLYEKEAARIAALQKDILAISQNEAPFDVFICYKETDENGFRTRDSALAQDIYYQLVEAGYKVFFSRITLEDKLGQKYEPYIFAALNSAKAMVVVGTKPEHFNAVWVKNEWSRYLALMRQDRKKLLIPCYRDMDPYDMPEELSMLQSQDMGKIGFIQDLIRGISKVLDADKPETTAAPAKETVVVQQSGGSSVNIETLLKRAFMFLEDGNWTSADEYCERVLDIDPENAQAYLGKLMAELQVRRKEQLENQKYGFSFNNNYEKVIRFGDELLVSELVGYIKHIAERNEHERITGIYDRAKQIMERAGGTSKTTERENLYREACKMFESITTYEDAAKLAEVCHEKAEITRKNNILFSAKQKMSGEVVGGYKDAILLLETIPGWEDADEKIKFCHKKIEEINERDAARKAERERQAEVMRKEKERLAGRNKKIAIVAAVVVCLVVAFVVLWTNVIIPNGEYNEAVSLMEAGEYEKAIKAFTYLDGYKDSAAHIEHCNTAILDGKYEDAVALMDEGKYEEAIAAFRATDSYKDSDEKTAACEKELLKTADVDDYVCFGAYEQDNDTTNGEENIEWIVLAKEDNRLFVLSRYALDCQQFNTTASAVWKTSSLRAWLNEDFLGAAFSTAEQSAIPIVDHSGIEDRVFLLSTDELKEYVGTVTVKKCQPTAYAVANGVVTQDNGNCRWGLRTLGDLAGSIAAVDDHGETAENSV